MRNTPRITYKWEVRLHLPSGDVDEFSYWGSDGDTTPVQRLQLSVIDGETDEQKRERIRQALGRQDVHWW